MVGTITGVVPTINTIKVNQVSPDVLTNNGSISFSRAISTKTKGKKFKNKFCSVRLLLLGSFIFQVLFMGVIAFTTSTVGLRQTTTELSDKILDNVVDRVSTEVHSIFSLPWKMSEAAYRQMDRNPANFYEDFMRPQLYKIWQIADGNLVTIYSVLPNGDFYGYYHNEAVGAYDQYITINRTKSIYGYFTPVLDSVTGSYDVTNPLTVVVENYDIRANEPWWKQVLEEKTHLWSNVYYDPGFPGTTFYSSLYPVYNDAGDLLAIFGADLSSTSLRNYLKNIFVSAHAEIWIMEPSTGALVASSNSNERTYTDTSIKNVTYVRDSNIEIIREVSTRLLARGITDSYSETHEGIIVNAVKITDNTLELILVIAYPKSDFLGVVTQYQKIILAVSAVAFALSLAAGIYVMYLVTSPLTKLGQQMDVISDGTFESHELNKSARQSSRLYEIYSLQEDFQRMVTALRSFGKFVPVDIVRHLLRNNAEAVAAVAQKDLTVMFSDIKGFTQKVEEMSPQQLSMLLSDYLNTMCAVIVDKDGTVDKFIGDAIMALWNVPTPVKQHPSLACAAALDSLKSLEELNKKWIMNGLPDIQCRIGIHTGKALVGNLGSNERLAYTAIGDNINLGSRLEALNKKYETSILISGEVYDSVKEEYLCRFLDIVVVQGRTTPTRIYELVSRLSDATPQTLHRCENHSQAVSLFFARQFDVAIEILNALHRVNPLDTTVQMMMERAQFALERNSTLELPNEWTGYLVLNEK